MSLQPIPAIVKRIQGCTSSRIGKMEIDELAKSGECLENAVMDHTAIVGLVAEEESVIILTFVVHLASNADVVIVNAVCGDDLDVGSVGVGDDVLNGMRARLAHVYSSF